MVQNEENSTSSTEEYLHTISKSEERERLTAMLSVNNCDVRFQIDTGADVSTICKRFVRKEQVRPCSRTLTMWNKSTVNIAGETTLDVVNPKTNEVFIIQFLVVNNNFHCLLGLEAVKSVFLKPFAIAYQPFVFYYPAYHLATEELILLKCISIYYTITPVNNTQHNLMR